MLQVTFQTDGKVQVFAMQDGDVISVTTEANKLPVMLPKETYDALLAGVRELHETRQAVMPRAIKRI